MVSLNLYIKISTLYSLLSYLLSESSDFLTKPEATDCIATGDTNFVLYTLQIISATQKLFADTKLPKNILQQIVIRYLPRNLT